MAKIDININNVKSMNPRLKYISLELKDVAHQLASVKSSIDHRILQRTGVDIQLNNAVNSLQELEQKVNNIHKFVEFAMNRYIQADRKIVSSIIQEDDKTIWDQIAEAFNTANEVVWGFRKGLLDTVVSTVEGLWEMVTHPIDTFNGLVHVVKHPIQTGKAIWESIETSWNNDVVNGDAESRSHWFGRAFGEVALAVVGTKGIDKAAKAVKAAATSSKVKAGSFGDMMNPDDLTRYERFWDYADHSINPEDRVKITHWSRPPSGSSYSKNKTVYDNPSYFDQTNGDVIYPGTNGDPNINGFVNGKFETIIMEKGTKIDRYGNNGSGRYFSPYGDSFESRALPPFMKEAPYEVYEVVSPFEVKTGPIAPWFDQPGMGTQFFTDSVIKDTMGNYVPANVRNLVENKYIKIQKEIE